jgi:hypothetical protein
MSDTKKSCFKPGSVVWALSMVEYATDTKILIGAKSKATLRRWADANVFTGFGKSDPKKFRRIVIASAKARARKVGRTA